MVDVTHDGDNGRPRPRGKQGACGSARGRVSLWQRQAGEAEGGTEIPSVKQEGEGWEDESAAHRASSMMFTLPPHSRPFAQTPISILNLIHPHF